MDSWQLAGLLTRLCHSVFIRFAGPDEQPNVLCTLAPRIELTFTGSPCPGEFNLHRIYVAKSLLPWMALTIVTPIALLSRPAVSRMAREIVLDALQTRTQLMASDLATSVGDSHVPAAIVVNAISHTQEQVRWLR